MVHENSWSRVRSGVAVGKHAAEVRTQWKRQMPVTRRARTLGWSKLLEMLDEGQEMDLVCVVNVLVTVQREWVHPYVRSTNLREDHTNKGQRSVTRFQTQDDEPRKASRLEELGLRGGAKRDMYG